MQENFTPPQDQNNEDTYAGRGVSSGKQAVANAAKSTGDNKGLYPNAFCKIIPDPRNKKYVKISHADGAGTKSSLAYIYWKETGDTSVFAGIVQDSIVMNLDDVMCVGGILGEMDLVSSIDRNTFRIPDEILPVLFQAEYDFREKMAPFGINISGGVGETADVPDTVRTLVVNNSLFTKMKLSDVIDNANIAAGDYIVGLSSSGRAIYEDDFNGGMGSNGLTNARHDVFSSTYRTKYPESFDSHLLEKNNAYNGSMLLTELVNPDPNEPGYQTTVGKLVLSPTRTYAPIMMKVFRQVGTKAIHGMIHCSGGGQTKMLKSLNYGLTALKSSMFEVPYLFSMIQEQSGLAWEQMYKTFNMGHRLEICLPDHKTAMEIIKISRSFNVDAKIIGTVEKTANPDEKSVQIYSPCGDFIYSDMLQH